MTQTRYHSDMRDAALQCVCGGAPSTNCRICVAADNTDDGNFSHGGMRPAAPARTEAMQAQSTTEFALATAEQAVLDAMKEPSVERLRSIADGAQDEDMWLRALAEAELARRGLKS